MQNGGCHPIDGCQDGTPFAGADFQFLAANVARRGHAEHDPAGRTDQEGRQRQDRLHRPDARGHAADRHAGRRRGPRVRDEVATVNKLVDELREDQGVNAIVVLIHEGGQQNAPSPTASWTSTAATTSPARSADRRGPRPEVDLVVTAHTHQPYICKFNGIPATSASSFGRLVTDIDLTIDHQTKDVTAVDAHNVIVTRDGRRIRRSPRSSTTTTRSRRRSRTASSARSPPTSRAPSVGDLGHSQESALGDVIADAQLASTRRPTSAAP